VRISPFINSANFRPLILSRKAESGHVEKNNSYSEKASSRKQENQENFSVIMELNKKDKLNRPE